LICGLTARGQGAADRTTKMLPAQIDGVARPREDRLGRLFRVAAGAPEAKRATYGNLVTTFTSSK